MAASQNSYYAKNREWLRENYRRKKLGLPPLPRSCETDGCTGTVEPRRRWCDPCRDKKREAAKQRNHQRSMRRYRRKRGGAYKSHADRAADRGHVSVDDKQGYRLVGLPPNDPLHCMVGRSGYVREHRLVMARHIGRPLFATEFVHHKNGLRGDNRIENLELWTRDHPDGQRVADMLDWCVEFIERYARTVPI